MEKFLPRRALIDGFGDGGFRFAGMSHRGALLVLPSGMRAWRPSSLDDVEGRDFAAVIADRTVATAVARHKSHFFIEKDAAGHVIDYVAATTGHLRIVPEGEAKAALAKDYAAMLADEVMVGDALSFDELLEACADLKAKANRAAV